jgi:hypothetical protein
MFLMSNASIICNNLVLRGFAISPVKRNPADLYIEIRRLLDALHTIRLFQARTMPAVVVCASRRTKLSQNTRQGCLYFRRRMRDAMSNVPEECEHAWRGDPVAQFGGGPTSGCWVE